MGEFKGARAHRMPPDIGRNMLKGRTVTDMVTGETVEAAMGKDLDDEALTKRLDKVRDIRVTVYLYDKGYKGMHDDVTWAEKAVHIRPLREGSRWSDQ